MRSFCSEPSNKKPWKPHSGVGTKGSQKKELFQSCSSTSTCDSQVIISTPELFCILSWILHSPLEVSIGKFQRHLQSVLIIFVLETTSSPVLSVRQTALSFTQVLRSETWNLLLTPTVPLQIQSSPGPVIAAFK